MRIQFKSGLSKQTAIAIAVACLVTASCLDTQEENSHPNPPFVNPEKDALNSLNGLDRIHTGEGIDIRESEFVFQQNLTQPSTSPKRVRAAQDLFQLANQLESRGLTKEVQTIRGKTKMLRGS